MDFQLNEDQHALAHGLREFCDGRVPPDRLAALEAGFDRELWSELAAMGVFNLRVAETDGGVGLGMADAVVVFSELGRRLVPGPLIWSHLAAPLLEGAGTGDRVIGGVDLNGAGSQPLLVEHLDVLDALLVLRPAGVYRVEPGAIRSEPIATPLDPLTPVRLVAALPDGERIAGVEASRQLWLEGCALASALLLGIAEATQEMAVAYAKQREQFGRAIGSFQALKHIMADMFVRQEVARAAVYAAAATIDDPPVGDVERTVATAKITAGDAAIENARACIQIHGGMGYTWEVPAHYYFKRAYVLESSFGSAEAHADRMAEPAAPSA